MIRQTNEEKWRKSHTNEPVGPMKVGCLLTVRARRVGVAIFKSQKWKVKLDKGRVLQERTFFSLLVHLWSITPTFREAIEGRVLEKKEN